MSYQKIAAGLLSALLVGGASVPALADTASAAGTPRTVTVFCFYPSYALKAYAVGSGALGALICDCDGRMFNCAGKSASKGETYIAIFLNKAAAA